MVQGHLGGIHAKYSNGYPLLLQLGLDQRLRIESHGPKNEIKKSMKLKKEAGDPTEMDKSTKSTFQVQNVNATHFDERLLK